MIDYYRFPKMYYTNWLLCINTSQSSEWENIFSCFNEKPQSAMGNNHNNITLIE